MPSPLRQTTGDGETEHGGQGRPTQSEQHALDHLTAEILPRVRTFRPTGGNCHDQLQPRFLSSPGAPGNNPALPPGPRDRSDDDVNTFQHVVECLRKIIPGMSEDNA